MLNYNVEPIYTLASVNYISTNYNRIHGMLPECLMHMFHQLNKHTKKALQQDVGLLPEYLKSWLVMLLGPGYHIKRIGKNNSFHLVSQGLFPTE